MPRGKHILPGMTFLPAIPTRSIKVPASPEWIHEVKYDGFRLIVHRDGDRVRLLARNRHDWTARYPWIAESALKNHTRHFVIDGEAVVLGLDGVADFNALYSRKCDEQVQLYAFDILALDGDDLRELPLSMRKTNLARLLRRRPDGIFVAPFEQGEIGEMRASGVRGLLVFCADYHCSHSIAISGDPWPDDARLSDLEARFVCKACGNRGADVRPDFDWDKAQNRL
jgi:bifunctional non-homologous end joining protein LigD